MDSRSKPDKKPDWDRLFEIAAAQEGYFTTRQAAVAGYYPALLAKYLHGGRIERVRHGIYRVIHFPAGEHEELVVVWLWTERIGVFSYETALALHRLSDVLPARIHVSLPASWSARRLRIPDGVELHFDDVSETETVWIGAVRTTGVARTLTDCARAALGPDLLGQAVQEAEERGLVDPKSVPEVIDYLKLFGAQEAAGAREQKGKSRKDLRRNS